MKKEHKHEMHMKKAEEHMKKAREEHKKAHAAMKHVDEKQDKKLIKKEVKKSCLK